MKTALPPRAELIAALCEDNARLPRPLPVCPDCGMPYESKDAGWLDAGRCSTCDMHRIECLVRDLVTASDRPSTLRALEAITRLAM